VCRIVDVGKSTCVGVLVKHELDDGIFISTGPFLNKPRSVFFK